MRKKTARAITFHEFRQRLNRPDPRFPHPRETFLNRIFTSLARKTGLTARARQRLIEKIRSIENQVETRIGEWTLAAERINYLHYLQNRVVDGGWGGLWTSFRICAGVL